MLFFLLPLFLIPVSILFQENEEEAKLFQEGNEKMGYDLENLVGLKNGKGLDEGTKAGTKKISLEKEFIKLKKVVRQRFP